MDGVRMGGASNGVVDTVELEVAVELGGVTLTVADLLRLTEGSVIELARPVGAPVDLVVNGTPVASGDVVVVDGILGFRVTELVVTPDSD